jgi:CDP-diacylglycerol--serine O-phosphatidyltransferase
MSLVDFRKSRTENEETRRASFRERVHTHIYILPNLLTTMNMFFGFYAIIAAIQKDFKVASFAIVASAIFDLLDGRVARMTRSTSQFGAEYDSLSDLVSFGLAPGISLFLWALQPFGRLGWLAAFFYVACAALRLARFNVHKSVVEPGYFHGLPTPMAAGIVASSIMAFNELGWEGSRSILLLAMTFLLGFTMVSNFRYRSFKDFDFRRRLPFIYLVLGVFLIAVIAIQPEITLFILFSSYAMLGLVFGLLRMTLFPANKNPQNTNNGDQHDDAHNDLDEYGLPLDE